MLPAGLGILAVSPKAAALYDSAKLQRVFFDLGDMDKANATGYFPYTPSLPLLYGLRESIADALRGGAGERLRAASPPRRGHAGGGESVGAELCARQPKWHSDTVSAIMVPPGINGAGGHRHRLPALQPGARRRTRPDGGKLFRIGHLGDLNECMLLGGIAGAEMAMRDVGHEDHGRAAASGRPRSTGAARPSRSRSASCRPARPTRSRRPAARTGRRGRGAMSHTRYEPARQRLQRSELAVPGSQPGMFPKALDSDADYVFLDLEDAVAPADKEQARKNVIQALLDLDWRGRGKTISVRINGIDTHYMYRDVVDVVEQAGHRLDTVLIPEGGGAGRRLPGGRAAHPDRGGQGDPAPDRHRGDHRVGARHGQRRGDRASRSRRLEAMHFGVADYAASCARAPSSSAACTPTIRAISGTRRSPA